MGLLNPLLLLLAGAVAVPLLLHLLQRHQGPRVVFPALRYLRRAEKESARRIRLRQLLLMLLRVAAVLLIAFAAARPFIGVGGVGHSPTAAVIVIDNSMSSAAVEGEQRVLDALRARALEALDAAGPDDVFWLLRAGDPAEPALLGDAAATALRVRETEPSASAADIGASLQRAAAILAAGADGRATEIHLLTDLQAAGWNVPVGADSSAPPVVMWHPGTTAPDNLAATRVEVSGGMAPIAGQRLTIAAAIAGGSASAGSPPAAEGSSDGDGQVAVRLVIDGTLLAAARARPGTEALLTLPPRPAGLMTGSVEIDADALHADDRRYFVARVQPPPSVALSSGVPFVREALEVLAEAGRVQLASANADIAILSGAAGASAAGAGTSLVILPPASPTELAAANRRLTDAGIPWRYGAPTAAGTRFEAVQQDPLLRQLADARVNEVYPLEALTDAPGDSVLLRLADGGAWAVRGTRSNGGTFVLLASALSEEASSLPTSALMLPLLDRITGAWSLSLPPQLDVEPGQQVAVVAGVTHIERPDGTRDSVTADVYRTGSQPGIYRMLRDDSTIAAFAVNAPATESDLARLDAAEFRNRLPGWQLHATTSDGAWARAIYRERLGSELWRPLLFALLLVLLAESLVAATGPGRNRSAPVDDTAPHAAPAPGPPRTAEADAR